MNPIRIVSLFCGMGNADAAMYDATAKLGIEIEIVAAYDSWPKAVEVYNANLHPVAKVADVKAMTRADLPPHDLIIGGPPCQPFSVAGKRAGHDDPRNCLPDFLRLVGFREPDESPYVMENVVSRLINAPWSERLCAVDFGDVTSRKRWFYSNYLLHVIPTPGPRRIRDIRDHDEDRRVLCKRAGCKAGKHEHYDDTLDTLDTLSAHSWHGHDIRGSGKLVAIVERSCGGNGVRIPSDNDTFLAFSSQSYHNANKTAAALKIGLRSASTKATATTFEDDEVLGSLLANSPRGNRTRELIGCRNPSLLEMARAHSIPDSWDWQGATKTDRGKMIANSWPRGMGTAVGVAILSALVAERTAKGAA